MLYSKAYEYNISIMLSALVIYIIMGYKVQHVLMLRNRKRCSCLSAEQTDDFKCCFNSFIYSTCHQVNYYVSPKYETSEEWQHGIFVSFKRSLSYKVILSIPCHCGLLPFYQTFYIDTHRQMTKMSSNFQIQHHGYQGSKFCFMFPFKILIPFGNFDLVSKFHFNFGLRILVFLL